MIFEEGKENNKHRKKKTTKKSFSPGLRTGEGWFTPSPLVKLEQQDKEGRERVFLRGKRGKEVLGPLASVLRCFYFGKNSAARKTGSQTKIKIHLVFLN